MNSTSHRNNSDFQLRYFLAGSCHTPDGAWALMYGQKIDVEGKIKHTQAQKLRRGAAIMKAKNFLANNPNAPAWERTEKEAEIIECESAAPVAELNLKAAEEELATINQIMAELEPLRKYKHLPILEANEAAQREEWLGELKARAKNFLVSQGAIPADHLETMRCHPDFVAELVPYIRQIVTRMKASGDGLEPLTQEKALFIADANMNKAKN